MIKLEHDSRLALVEQQKKRAYLGLLVSTSVILLLSLALVLMATKRERVVIMPSIFTEDIWLETNKVSSSYIRQMGDYFIKLALTTTPDTAENQFSTILKNTYPRHYADLKTGFVHRLEQIKKKSVSTVFNAREYEVDVRDLSVIITGDFELGSGKQKLDIAEKSYKVSFVYDNGRLWVNEIVEVKS
jgi:conjugal transfer pilus assembly protein TraE